MAAAPAARSPGAETAGDLPALVREGLAAGRAVIVIPPGRYRVAPERHGHLWLEGLTNVEIRAAGVEMICTETTRALTIRRCRNVTVRGLTIDYDPLPFTQGRIESISADGRTHEIRLFDGYPRADRAVPFKYEIFRPDTRTLRFGDYHSVRVEAVAPDRLRVAKTGGGSGRPGPEQAGDIAVIACSDAPGGQATHAVLCEQCEGVTLEDLRLYASNCFGFLETDCSGTVYRRCIVDRRPPETDVRPRGDARIRSLNADAFHSKFAGAGPSYLGCRARFQGDDCIAINGDDHMVLACTGRVLRVAAKYRMNIRPGDPLEIVAYDGVRQPDARAVAVEPDGAPDAAETAFMGRQRLDAGLREHLVSSRARVFRVTLDRDADLPRGSVICAANRIGSGFRIEDGDFGFNRSRGFIVKASRGTIAGNRLEGCFMEAIRLSSEYWWLEAGSSDDVTIRGNTIRNCGGTAIAVDGRGARDEIAPPGAHRGIVIESNVIEACPRPALRIEATRGVRLDRNLLSLPAGDRPAIELKNSEETGGSDAPPAHR